MPINVHRMLRRFEIENLIFLLVASLLEVILHLLGMLVLHCYPLIGPLLTLESILVSIGLMFIVSLTLGMIEILSVLA